MLEWNPIPQEANSKSIGSINGPYGLKRCNDDHNQLKSRNNGRTGQVGQHDKVVIIPSVKKIQLTC